MGRKMFIISCVILFTFFARLNGELVKVQGGEINGTVGKSKNGRLFQQFYAIQYAEPPVGELRLKPPVPVKPWAGIKDGSKPPPRCIQPDFFLVLNTNHRSKSEDCLYLNVFVPNNLFNDSANAPVMMWIHGGSFLIGSGTDYNPEYFMDKDVILVTINYRLGALGFFGLNNDEISGNFGMKDQAMALHWVKNNIAAFGGDPDNITLMGESAGAASVHLHMFSPLSRGLFQKAILQSGSALASWAFRDASLNVAYSTDFLDISGCSGNDSEKILKCLQGLPAKDFVDLEKKLHGRNNVSEEILFMPIVESNVKNQPFLTQKPTSSGYFTNVPWICGMNSGEGAMLVTQLLLKGGAREKLEKESIIRLLRPNLMKSTGFKNSNESVEKFTNFYFSSNDTNSGVMLKFVNIITDFSFLYPLIKSIRSNRDRKFVYLYDHRGSFSWQDFGNLTIDLGVSHADELPLMFRSQRLESKWTPQDKIVSETLIKFWTNFAITGDPNGLSNEKLWKPTESDGPIEYLHIKSDSTVMEKNLLKERFEFWDSLLH